MSSHKVILNSLASEPGEKTNSQKPADQALHLKKSKIISAKPLGRMQAELRPSIAGIQKSDFPMSSKNGEEGVMLDEQDVLGYL